MIYIEKNFITNEELQILNTQLKKYYQKLELQTDMPWLANIETGLGFDPNSKKASYWSESQPIVSYNQNTEHDQALLLLYRIQQRVKSLLQQTYNKEFRLVNALMQKMKTGSANPMHTDDQPGYDDLVHTCLLYLSGYGIDFQGGELYFSVENQLIKPEEGMLIFFEGHTNRPHEVKPVLSGSRENIIFQFTVDEEANELSLKQTQ
jgi:hypothetical protein